VVRGNGWEIEEGEADSFSPLVMAA